MKVFGHFGRGVHVKVILNNDNKWLKQESSIKASTYFLTRYRNFYSSLPPMNIFWPKYPAKLYLNVHNEYSLVCHCLAISYPSRTGETHVSKTENLPDETTKTSEILHPVVYSVQHLQFLWGGLIFNPWTLDNFC